MSESQWLLRIESGLAAHFFQPDGSSRPGTDWAVGLKRGNDEYKVIVRAYLSADATEATKRDQQYQAQTVLGYVSDLLDQGWTPEQGGQLQITILNPKEESASANARVWATTTWSPSTSFIPTRNCGSASSPRSGLHCITRKPGTRSRW